LTFIGKIRVAIALVSMSARDNGIVAESASKSTDCARMG